MNFSSRSRRVASGRSILVLMNLDSIRHRYLAAASGKLKSMESKAKWQNCDDDLITFAARRPLLELDIIDCEMKGTSRFSWMF